MNRWLNRTGLVVATAVAASTLVSAPAHADIGTDVNRWCGNSANVEQIEVKEWPNGEFKVMLTPTYGSRFSPDVMGTTVSMWHAIQACVPGLYDDLADSIWDQLYCHQNLGFLPGKVGYKTGNTYDLESWIQPGANEFNECGNTLNTDDYPDGKGHIYRPDGRGAGYTDLTPPSNVG